MSETAVPATPRSANTLAAATATSARFAARSTRGRGLIFTSPIPTDNQSVFLPRDIPSSSNASASNCQPATSAIGSLLCQDALGRVVVGFLVTGPASGLSEVLVWGCEPATLD